MAISSGRLRGRACPGVESQCMSNASCPQELGLIRPGSHKALEIKACAPVTDACACSLVLGSPSHHTGCPQRILFTVGSAQLPVGPQLSSTDGRGSSGGL